MRRPPGREGLFLEDCVHYAGDPSAPTCNTSVALAAMAVRTERIRLGAEGNAVHAKAAVERRREAAAVDQLSGGRMILGVGLGDRARQCVDASFVRFGEESDAGKRGLEILVLRP